VLSLGPLEAAAYLLKATEDDVHAYMAFPREQWTSLYSTNVLERLHHEVKRRTAVVVVFPDVSAPVLQLNAATRYQCMFGESQEDEVAPTTL
jgi:transposase-like protein